jgi:hypothetical protein
MPVSITIDHAHRSLQVHANGEIGLRDVEAFLDRLALEGAMAYRKYVDSRNATAKYTAADVVQLTARLNLYSHVNRRGAIAVVVNPEHRDIMEQFLALGRPQRPGRAFLDGDQAATWLQQQPDV